jgi:hypothetical protein
MEILEAKPAQALLPAPAHVATALDEYIIAKSLVEPIVYVIRPLPSRGRGIFRARTFLAVDGQTFHNPVREGCRPTNAELANTASVRQRTPTKCRLSGRCDRTAAQGVHSSIVVARSLCRSGARSRRFRPPLSLCRVCGRLRCLPPAWVYTGSCSDIVCFLFHSRRPHWRYLLAVPRPGTVALARNPLLPE